MILAGSSHEIFLRLLSPALHNELQNLGLWLSQRRALLHRTLKRELRQLGPDNSVLTALLSLAPAASPDQPSDSLLAYADNLLYHGRRLAKLNVPARTVARALQACSKVIRQLGAPQPGPSSLNLEQTLGKWELLAALIVNHAYYQVAEAEAQTYQQLFQAELASTRMEELLAKLLQPLAVFTRADSALAFLLDRDRSQWRPVSVAATDPIPPVPVTPIQLRRLSRSICWISSRRTRSPALAPEWNKLPTCWSVPLRIENTLVGVMQFAFRKTYPWLPRETAVLQTAAELCSKAADKTRLLETLADREHQIRCLAQRIVEVQERERKRISSELHDEAGQSLMCIRLALDMLQRKLPPQLHTLRDEFQQIQSMVEATIAEIRRVLSSLSPAVLSQLGLPAAIRQLASRLTELTGTKVHLRLAPLPNLPEALQTTLYRIVQECLSNVARHAAAGRVNISLAPADQEVRLRVSDNGVGFQVDQALHKAGSFGLSGIQERAALLGGQLHIRSAPGRGTTITVRLPLSTALTNRS